MAIYVISKICLDKCVCVYSLYNRMYYKLHMLIGRIMANILYLYWNVEKGWQGLIHSQYEGLKYI